MIWPLFVTCQRTKFKQNKWTFPPRHSRKLRFELTSTGRSVRDFLKLEYTISKQHGNPSGESTPLEYFRTRTFQAADAILMYHSPTASRMRIGYMVHNSVYEANSSRVLVFDVQALPPWEGDYWEPLDTDRICRSFRCPERPPPWHPERLSATPQRKVATHTATTIIFDAVMYDSSILFDLVELFIIEL